MVQNIPRVTLNNDTSMPILGLGVYEMVDEKELNSSILDALDLNYSLIDTASVYKNEEGVGKAIRNSKVPREELFVITKLWNTAQRLADIQGAFERSLERLQLDYIDLYMIHWPVKGCYVDTWKAMEKIYRSGKARAIGVSNFQIHHLTELLNTSEVIPAVNQFEHHPLLYQPDLIDFCHSQGIVPQASSPLAKSLIQDNPVLVEIGQHYGKTPIQVGLRWAIQKGMSVIPKSSSRERIVENSEVFDFHLDDVEMTQIDGLNLNYRIGDDPNTM